MSIKGCRNKDESDLKLCENCNWETWAQCIKFRVENNRDIVDYDNDSKQYVTLKDIFIYTSGRE